VVSDASTLSINVSGERPNRAVAWVSAELVAPYPPGVPVLAPGERVTRATLDSLVRARDERARIGYAADRTLATLYVVAE